MEQLTANEKAIIELLRTLLPFESITIGASKDGKPNNFTVLKSRKAVLTDTGLIYLAI